MSMQRINVPSDELIPLMIELMVFDADNRPTDIFREYPTTYVQSGDRSGVDKIKSFGMIFFFTKSIVPSFFVKL